MTLDDLREFPGVREAWPAVGGPLLRFLNDRLLEKAAGAKCVIETAQAETAVQKELAMLIRDFATLGHAPSDHQPAPRMKPLHSMQSEKSENP